MNNTEVNGGTVEAGIVIMLTKCSQLDCYSNVAVSSGLFVIYIDPTTSDASLERWPLASQRHEWLTAAVWRRSAAIKAVIESFCRGERSIIHSENALSRDLSQLAGTHWAMWQLVGRPNDASFSELLLLLLLLWLRNNETWVELMRAAELQSDRCGFSSRAPRAVRPLSPACDDMIQRFTCDLMTSHAISPPDHSLLLHLLQTTDN